jgi:guanine deaminase
MCMTASLWARIDKLYYAAKYEDVKVYGGFEDEDFMAELAKPEDKRQVPCFELLREEAVEVWKKYQTMPDNVHY